MREGRAGRATIGGILLFLIFVGFMGCGKIDATNIGDIQGHPRDYANKKVTVFGEVTETFSLILVKYFTLTDETGEIVVITERPLPAKGEKLKISGVVQETFSLGPRTALVLLEDPPKKRR